MVPVTRGLPQPKKENWKINKMVHKFQNACQERTGCNMVKSSIPNAPSTWFIFLCPRTHAASIPCVHTCKIVHCKCTTYCTLHYIITLFNVGNVLLCIIYQLNCTVSMYVTQYHIMYSIRCYPWLCETTVGLGTYYLLMWGAHLYLC
jgi:hypothetical protein